MVLGDELDYLLDFGRDHVALQELFVVKDIAEDALGEQVLNKHFFNCVVVQIRVNRLATEVGERLIGGAIIRVGLALLGEDREDVGGKFGQLARELFNGFTPVFNVLLLEGEEQLQDVDQFLG